MNTKDKIMELVPDCKGKIGLCVVLRAINLANPRSYLVDIHGYFWVWEHIDNPPMGNPKIQWNLEHDNYDQQSEECKQFIGSLLGVV